MNTSARWSARRYRDTSVTSCASSAKIRQHSQGARDAHACQRSHPSTLAHLPLDRNHRRGRREVAGGGPGPVRAALPAPRHRGLPRPRCPPPPAPGCRTAPPCPRPLVAPRASRFTIDEPGVTVASVPRRVRARTGGARRPVPGDDDIGVVEEMLELGVAGRRSEVDERAAFPDQRVDGLFLDLRTRACRPAGRRPRTRQASACTRSRDDAREVEDAHAVERGGDGASTRGAASRCGSTP